MFNLFAVLKKTLFCVEKGKGCPDIYKFRHKIVSLKRNLTNVDVSYMDILGYNCTYFLYRGGSYTAKIIS